MKRTVLSLTMAAAVLAGGFTLNTHAAVPDAAARQRLKDRVKDKLGLTDDQLAQIKSGLKSEKGDLTDIMKRLRAAKTELNDTIAKSGATEAEIHDAAAKLAAVETDAAVLHAKALKTVNAALTPEQQAKLKEGRARAGRVMDRLIDRIGEHGGKQ